MADSSCGTCVWQGYYHTGYFAGLHRLPLKYFVFKPYVAQFASWLPLPADCTAHLMSGMAVMEMPARLQDATWEEVLLDLVPSWIEKGTRLPEFQFVKPQVITRDEIKKVPGWNEKGNKLLPQKLGYV